MNITLSGTKVSMDGHTLAFQKNNLVDSMVITVDTDETWQYKLDVKYPCKDSKGEDLYNVIDLTRVGNTCTAILQATMLPFNGKYTMQLRGVSGDKVYHTDTFDVWVKYSIDPGKVYDPVPSEFYQIEQAVTEQAANAKQSATESAESATNAAASATKAENAVVHSPIVGENGNWFIWDFEKSEYVDSGKSASTPPITPDTAGKYLTNDGSKAEWEAIDIPQSDWEQTDESAADYVKNRPFGNFVYHSIDFYLSEQYRWKVKKAPTFDELLNTAGEKTARIEAYGSIYCQGKAVTVLDEVYGNIKITFTSDDKLNELVFSGQYGNLTSLTINKSNITWNTLDTYSLFIDGLTYTRYQKLSRDSVEGTLPATRRDDYILVSSADGSWYARSIESINPIFQLSGASAGQIVKITAVDESGKPISWEAVDMPGGGSGGKQLLYRHNISQDTVLTTDSFDTSGANIDLSVYSRLYIRGMFVCNSPTETYGLFYLNGLIFAQIQYFNRKSGQNVGFEADIVCLKTQNESSAGLLSFVWCSEFNLGKFDNIYVENGPSKQRINGNIQSIGFSARESADIFAVKAGSYVEVWGD